MRFPTHACLVILTLAALPAESGGNTIRLISDLADRIAGQASPGRTFELTAEVLLANKQDGQIWVLALEDHSGCVVAFSDCLNKTYVPVAGDTIRCSGDIVDQPFGRRAFVRQTQFVSHHAPKSPIRTSISELQNGRLDFRLVRLTGTVYDARKSETNPHWVLLALADQQSVINVSVLIRPEDNFDITGLVGDTLVLDGICMLKELGPRRHLGRVVTAFERSSLYTRSESDNRKGAVPDIADLSDASANQIPLFKRHQAVGRVCAVWDGQALVSTTNDMMVHVSFVGDELPHYGQVIEATGFPETDLFNINLTRAKWREIEIPAFQRSDEKTDTACLIPGTSSALQLQNEFHGKLIRFVGTVLTLPQQGDKSGKIHIQTGNCVIPVSVNPLWESLSDVSIGCRVEIVGMCILESERWHPTLIYPKAHGFIVVARTASDVRIVYTPSWWTIQRLLILVGMLMAALAGFVVWNASLRRSAARKGRELFREQLGHVKADLRTEERTRLAVELHDTLAQNLTGVSMEIEAANDLRGDAPKPMLDHLGIAAKALKSCRDELRNCLWDLRSQALEEPDMTKALLKTLQPIINDSRLAVRFNVPRARLSDNTAHALLRVIRELVVNAIRHGNASAIKVAGTIDNGKLLCSVTDDGCGFDPDAAPGVLQGHFGLQGIQERIEELGGEFTIRSSCGKGTKATINIPIPHES